MHTALVLLQCSHRSRRFGQGTFTNSLLPHLKINTRIDLIVIQTDVATILKPQWETIDEVLTLSIPSLLGNTKLTGEDLPGQKLYSVQLAGILFEQLHKIPNVILWVNTIDYLNLCTELRPLMPQMKLFYVHHSFTWKYLVNISDESFKAFWKQNDTSICPKAFEMTEYQRRMAILADQVVAVTEHAKNFFIDVLDVPKEKIRVIYNGSNPKELTTFEKSALRKKYGFRRQDKILAVCGRITKDKGIAEALQAFQNLANKYEYLKIILIGTGHIPDFLHFATPYWSRVTYTGEVDKHIVSDLYLISDIGLIPSYHEQCSFTAIEMQLHGLPLIISDIDGLSELFEHEYDAIKFPITFDENGFKQIDSKNIAKGIDRLLSDSSLRQLLAINAWKKATNIHSVSKMRDEYDRLIECLSSIEHVHT